PHRCGVGSGGTYTLVKKGTIGMSRFPMTYSNGTANAWPSSASSEYARSKSASTTSLLSRSSAISRWTGTLYFRPANWATARLPAMIANVGTQVTDDVST